ncbi:hypothetical protein ABRQ22_17200 [Cellulosimicrobium sp. ES-005]|uniref:DUF1640 domain-containing protein n=1 Tax=Cellulosimicrobium sp. ES-005 TaxID=3163031 RepID=A0AAU8FY25_9MICO
MRLLKSVDRKLDDVVTKDMFQAESRRVDERFDEQGRDIADERTARAEAVAEEKSARQREDLALSARVDKVVSELKERADRMQVNLRWLAASILVPVALFLIERFGGGQ